MQIQALLQNLLQSQWKKRAWPALKGPILTRYDLQKIQAPKGAFVAKTSGSTGIPVEVERTHLSKIWWNATNLLETIWYRRDLSESFAVIRPFIQKELRRNQWGPAFSILGKTGPLYGHPVEGDLNGWLQKIQPGYLFCYPSVLETIDLARLKKLKGIKTTGETQKQTNHQIADTYSCEEMGTIAIQCPDHRNFYHVMENILLEILDEQDFPTDSGRVVLTDLTSQYLHRYDIGDYAERGNCPCGRGLQSIRKILGRRRNLVQLPDGSRHWPKIGSLSFRTIAPSLRRFQMVQIDGTTLELRLQVSSFLSEKEKLLLTQTIQQAIGFSFSVRFVYVESFPKGKFEEFVNLLSS